MMADLRRQILVLILFAELVLLAGSTGQAVAQERTPIREYTGDRVHIKDVPGSYQSLKEAMIEDHVAKQGTTVTAPAKNSLVAVPSGKEEATRAGIQNQMILALAASLLAVGLIVAALIWLARHRTRNTVESKIKQYKKNAVDVMDRLDALKARLKNLPVEDPDFKEPISGETLAVYQKIEGNLTGLWDRWLEVMDALDKAQALAKKDNALGTEKLKEAEKLVSDSKVFEQIEVEAQKCAASMNQLNQAHENARSAADVVALSQREILTGVEKVEKEGLPSVPYKPEIDGIAAQAAQAKATLTPDPIGARQTLDKAQERAWRSGIACTRFSTGTRKAAGYRRR